MSEQEKAMIVWDLLRTRRALVALAKAGCGDAVTASLGQSWGSVNDAIAMLVADVVAGNVEGGDGN